MALFRNKGDVSKRLTRTSVPSQGGELNVAGRTLACAQANSQIVNDIRASSCYPDRVNHTIREMA